MGDHTLEAGLSELGLDSKFEVCTTLSFGRFCMDRDHPEDVG